MVLDPNAIEFGQHASETNIVFENAYSSLTLVDHTQLLKNSGVIQCRIIEHSEKLSSRYIGASGFATKILWGRAYGIEYREQAKVMTRYQVSAIG